MQITQELKKLNITTIMKLYDAIDEYIVSHTSNNKKDIFLLKDELEQEMKMTFDWFKLEAIIEYNNEMDVVKIIICE